MKPFDQNGQFGPNVAGNDVRRLAVHGAGATIFSSGVGLAVQIISTVVLARLLAPADFGLVTMVTTVSLLLVNFGLNGFTEAVIQTEKLDHALASNLFWINLVAGLLLTAGFAGAGTLLARFYGNHRVAVVAMGVSLSIVVSSSSVLHLALLKRAMRFATLALNDILASIVAATISILFAGVGFGVWALVAGAIARPLSQALGAWWACRWLPGPPRSREGTLSLVRFALNIYGRFTINYFVRNMDNVLVGWRFGPAILGFYKKAYDLFLLSASQLIAPLTTVAVSALSRLDRESEEYKRSLVSALSTTAFVGMGLSGALTLSGEDLIRLLLGPGWEPAGAIFTFFGPGIGIMLLYNTHCWIHLSIGTPGRWFRWVFVEFAVTGLLFLAGLRFGPAGVAGAWTASFWILTIPAFWYAGKPIGFSATPVVRAVWRYIAASALAGGATTLLVPHLPYIKALSGASLAAARLILISTLFALFYIAAVAGLYGSFSPVRNFMSLAFEMLPSKRTRAKATLRADGSSGLGKALLKTPEAERAI